MYTATHAEAALLAVLLSVHATVQVAVPWALGANAKNGETQASDRA